MNPAPQPIWHWRRTAPAVLALLASPAWAACSCNVAVNSVGVLVQVFAQYLGTHAGGITSSVSLNCSVSLGAGPDQAVTHIGTLPADQAGSCASTTCSAAQAHSVNVTY